MRAYQGVRNIKLSENFAYELNGWSLNTIKLENQNLLIPLKLNFFTMQQIANSEDEGITESYKSNWFENI